MTKLLIPNQQVPNPTQMVMDPTVSKNILVRTSGYATMVHGRGCNPHRSTTTFANLEITSL